jgi:hypothetical protein
LLVSIVGASSVEIRLVFKPFYKIRWHVPYERPNLPAISEMVLSRSSLTILWIFSIFFVCAICGMMWTLTIFNQNFPAFALRNLRERMEWGGG